MILLGCGAADSMSESGLPPPVCDLRALATSLVGPADLCPPSEVFVYPARNEADPSPIPAEWDGEHACTKFEIVGDDCPGACAPRRCWLEGQRIECDSTCIASNRTTCFVLPASACTRP